MMSVKTLTDHGLYKANLGAIKFQFELNSLSCLEELSGQYIQKYKYTGIQRDREWVFTEVQDFLQIKPKKYFLTQF